MRSALDIPEDQPIAFAVLSRLWGAFIEVDKEEWPQIGHGRDIYIIQNPQDQLQTQYAPLFQPTSQSTSNRQQSRRSTSQSSNSAVDTPLSIPIQVSVPPSSPLESPYSPSDEPTQVISANGPSRGCLPASLPNELSVPDIVVGEDESGEGAAEEALLEASASRSKQAWPLSPPLIRLVDGMQDKEPLRLSLGVEVVSKPKRAGSRQPKVPGGPHRAQSGAKSALDIKRGRGRPRTKPFGPKRKRGRPKKEERAVALAASSVQVEE